MPLQYINSQGTVCPFLLSLTDPSGLRSRKPTTWNEFSIGKWQPSSVLAGPKSAPWLLLFLLPRHGMLLEPQSPSSLLSHTQSQATITLFSLEQLFCLFLHDSAAVIWLFLLQTKLVITLSSLYSKLFFFQVNSPQACSATFRPAHAPAPQLSSGPFPPNLSVDTAGEALPAAPLTQGTSWVQASSAQHKVLMQSAVNSTLEVCLHRHPEVINNWQLRVQSLR